MKKVKYKVIEDASNSIFVGCRAGSESLGKCNIALGDHAGIKMKGDYNLHIGEYKWKMTHKQWQKLDKALGDILEFTRK